MWLCKTCLSVRVVWVFLYVCVFVCAVQNNWHCCQLGSCPRSHIQTFTAVGTIFCGNPGTLSLWNTCSQFILIPLSAKLKSCCLYGIMWRRAGNTEERRFITSLSHYNAFDDFITSGLANEFERRVPALLRAGWQKKPVSPHDGLDEEWPWQHHTTESHARYNLRYELINLTDQ